MSTKRPWLHIKCPNKKIFMIVYILQNVIYDSISLKMSFYFTVYIESKQSYSILMTFKLT